MDRVRLGRVLGAGARGAARTLVNAIDAASAPGPTPAVTAGPKAANTQKQSEIQTKSTGNPKLVPAPGRIKAAGKGFAHGAFTPLRRASNVLWLEMMGAFFALFALSFGAGLWRHRAALSPAASAADHRRFAVYAIIALMFLYFACSSFLRAHRRGSA